MLLDAQARRAFGAYVALLVAALLVMTVRMDPTGIDRSATGSPHGHRAAPEIPANTR